MMESEPSRITPGQRRQAEMLRTGMNAIHQTRTGLLPAEMSALDTICDQVKAFALTEEHDPDLKAWYRAAVATQDILRDHSEAVKSEWLEAFADLPPMGW